MNGPVAVVGSGWAGCAAAVELASQGRKVTLFEAARTLGGRARQVEHEGTMLDNGQHILLGAYSSTLAMMRRVGIDPASALLRLPLQMRYPSGHGMEFVAPRLPAPFNLLAALVTARGLAAADKLSLARFSTAARWMGWQLNVDCSVTELLARFDQTPGIVRQMWRPLCLAALNTPPDRASAKVFLNVLRDSLGSARRSASDMLLPRVDLSALFPLAAARYVQESGNQVRTGSTVKSLSQTGDGWLLNIEGEAEAKFSTVVLATQPANAARLLEGFAPAEDFSFEYEAISTVYLQYDAALRLAHPFYALADRPEAGEWGQFVFDRGALDPAQKGLLAVVISASTMALEQGQEELTRRVCAQLSAALNMPLDAPRWAKVISEKRATFACTPDLRRPLNSTAHHGLVIAGDYTAGDYPATLEGAVRSGIAAAHALHL